MSVLELLDAMPVPAVLVRAEDRFIVYANLADVGLVGAAGPHEVVGRPVSQFIPPHDVDRVSDDIRDVRLGALVQPDNRFGIQRCDGSSGTVEAYPIPFEHDGERMMLSVLIDVTERVDAEGDLAAAEERYRSLVEVAPVGIAVQVEGRYAFANPEMVRMLGATSAEEVVGVPIASTIAPEDVERVGAAIRGTLSGATGSTGVEFDLLGLDGRRFAAEITCRRIAFDGQAASQAVIREIGPRKAQAAGPTDGRS